MESEQRVSRPHHSTGRDHVYLPGSTPRLGGGVAGVSEHSVPAHRPGAAYRVPLILCPKSPHLREGTELCLQHPMGISGLPGWPRARECDGFSGVRLLFVPQMSVLNLGLAIAKPPTPCSFQLTKGTDGPE